MPGLPAVARVPLLANVPALAVALAPAATAFPPVPATPPATPLIASTPPRPDETPLGWPALDPLDGPSMYGALDPPMLVLHALATKAVKTAASEHQYLGGLAISCELGRRQSGR
ncbi:MAG TPA: hypothetical protein VFG30_20215 [Polyangiales bacterium]|nr:hypothetical protein [Polyangiales bacterium]